MSSSSFPQSVYEPMYQPVIEAKNQVDAPPQSTNHSAQLTDAERGNVRRREGANRPTKNLRQRLSNIVSWYVPATGSANEDGNLLLNIPGIQEEEDGPFPGSDQKSILNNTLFSVNKLFGLSKIANLMEDGSEISLENVKISTGTIVEGRLYLGFEAQSFLISIEMDKLSELESSSIKHIPLRVHGNELFPKQIHFDRGVLFVSGYFMGKEGERMSILMKYTATGDVLAQSKSYSFPRFGGFSIDAEGSLLVASPQATEAQETARIFKLTPGFDRKQYYIRLGNQRSIYRPSKVAAHSAGNRGWVSVVLSSDQPSDVISEEEPSVHRRLLSFPCCKPDNLPVGTETKEWLKVESWNFQSLAPGEVMGLGERLLVIDENDHNIHYIEWNEEENQPTLRPISRPSTALFTSMTSDGEDAYLFTARDVFHFRFLK